MAIALCDVEIVCDFNTTGASAMRSKFLERDGKIKYALAAWLLGLPLPIVILALFFRGCDF
jgi:hypothetical protein